MRRKPVRKAESMKVTSLTGKAVITTELPKRSHSNGHVKSESGSRNEKLSSTSSSVDGAVFLPSASEDTEEKPSGSVGTSDLPDGLPKNFHMRSASLPANVRAPKGSASSSPSSSPRPDKKATRNKSFGGMTKNSRSKKAPLEIFSLPETDVDSGITVACERPTSGRASKRNLRIMDLMKNTKVAEEERKGKPTKEKSRVKLPSEKSAGKRSPNLARPDIRVPSNAPYAPNYLETDLDDDPRKRGNYLVDAQRSFHVFIPSNNKMNQPKRFTYFAGISASDEKLLRDKDTKRKRLGNLINAPLLTYASVGEMLQCRLLSSNFLWCLMLLDFAVQDGSDF